MHEHQRSHIVSTYGSIVQHLAEIRDVATTGKTPAGARVTPLPPGERERLVGALDGLGGQIAALVGSVVPDWQQAGADAGGIAATRMWVSILLRTVRELVHDLLPSRISKRYGALPSAEAERLRQQVEVALAAIDNVIRLAAGGKE